MKTRFLSLFCALLIGAAVLGCVAPRMARAADGSPYPRLDVLGRVLAQLERHYIGAFDDEALVHDAIKGMLRALDPHSSFLTPDEFARFQEDAEGRFCGVGLEVGIRDNALTVIAPIPDSPAARAGVRPGDRIVRIGERETVEMGLDEAVQLMRGAAGTEVRISVLRRGDKRPHSLTLRREPVSVRSVVSRSLAPGIVHLHVRVFQERVAADVRAALRAAEKAQGETPLRGVVLDLRRNPGGLLVEAVRVAEVFMPAGAVVSIRGRSGAVQNNYASRGQSPYRALPLVVLIDAGSASAAEIVAGALKDSGRALLVGTRSFGKGSVQRIFPLRGGAALKLTTALYHTPAGHVIQAAGIAPDVEVASLLPPEPDALTQAMREMPAERDLPGHLPPADAPQDGTAATATADTDAEPDYQLQVAFQILSGLLRAAQAQAPAQP
ncbi:MAG: S41 family peptidase [Myxococcales bacterium]|jgi:carboxyl-terminal processing protease|nr:S41 family peptidase [Myxococcales bacterium]